MSLPVRERLLAAILTAVGGVYGLPTPEDERDLPMTLVQDSPDVATTVYDSVQCTLVVDIGRAETATNGDRDAMRAQAHLALAALIAAMHVDDTFGGLAQGVDYTGGGIQVEVGRFVFAQASFAVRYEFVRGDATALVA